MRNMEKETSARSSAHSHHHHSVRMRAKTEAACRRRTSCIGYNSRGVKSLVVAIALTAVEATTSTAACHSKSQLAQWLLERKKLASQSVCLSVRPPARPGVIPNDIIMSPSVVVAGVRPASRRSSYVARNANKPFARLFISVASPYSGPRLFDSTSTSTSRVGSEILCLTRLQK